MIAIRVVAVMARLRGRIPSSAGSIDTEEILNAVLEMTRIVARVLLGQSGEISTLLVRHG